MLRELKLHLEAYQNEQQEINHSLQRLVERGELLKLEDLRQLEAGRARQERKTERNLRRAEVNGMLTSFNRRRLEI